jgi:hypothetical protein
MSLDVMAFILGGLLIGAGLFGGGIEIKEIKLPRITGAARVAAAVAGVAFVALAVTLNLKAPTKDNAAGPEETTRATKTFQAPMYDGMRLDACFEWANRCGEEPATAWCRTQGFSRAIDYPTENVGERGVATRLIGTQQVCNQKICASFVYITCEK